MATSTATPTTRRRWAGSSRGSRRTSRSRCRSACGTGCSGSTSTVLAAGRPTRRSSSEARGGNTRIDGARHRARRHGGNHRPVRADAPGHIGEERSMTGEPVTTVVGNTTAPAELRFTQAGVAVANFTVAQTPRTFNRQTNQWEDGQTLFMRCNVWRDQAETVAETLSEKGVRVVVTGTLQQ